MTRDDFGTGVGIVLVCFILIVVPWLARLAVVAALVYVLFHVTGVV